MLLLDKNKAVLRMPFLQKFNSKINWITGEVKIKNIKNCKQQQQTKLI